ncbi:MAG TPA: hypothetical protein VK233_01165 [Candidatus Dormibacteraeota bacterium]|nr:hypothetical protein [Candidatus Dormibacteraeota bacterium]
MSRVNDADLEAFLKQRGDLPEEGGFHSQDGLFFRRLDDGRVRVTVVKYTPIRGSSVDEKGRYQNPIIGSAREAIFSTILTPEVWASIAASVSYRDENSTTWDEARMYHMGELAGAPFR